MLQLSIFCVMACCHAQGCIHQVDHQSIGCSRSKRVLTPDSSVLLPTDESSEARRFLIPLWGDIPLARGMVVNVVAPVFFWD